MRLVFKLFLFLTSFSSFSQEVKIWGRVVDASSNEPLENVSIYIRDGNQGTFTNENGDFVFTFSQSDAVVIFQLVGYKPFQVFDFDVGKGVTVDLVPDPFFLDEIIVEADSSLQIMKEAFSRLNDNYPNKQYLIKGYYRESVLRDDSYVRFLDAAIGINDFSYRSDPLRRKVEVYNLRKSADFVEEDLWAKLSSFFFKDKNDFLISLNFRDILRRYHREPSYFRGMEKDLLEFFDFKMDTVFNNGMEPVARISFSASGLMNSTNGCFLVNLSDFAILSIELNSIPSKNFTSDDFMKKALAQSAVIEYRKVNDRYYLSRFFSQGAENMAAIDQDTGKGAQVLKMELWVNEVFDNKRFFEKIKNKNKLDWEMELKDLDIPYDSVFWRSYNFIPDSIEFKKMVRDLEKLESNE